MADLDWARYPRVALAPSARTWLTIQHQLHLAPNTIAAYARALDEYLTFCQQQHFSVEHATREHLAAYVQFLTTRPNPRRGSAPTAGTGGGLANATLQLRLTAVRLFYDYLVETAVRADNPVGRGHYTPGRAFGGTTTRGLLRRVETLPWIPDDEEYRRILVAATQEPLRNQFMLMLAYNCALRREELCALAMTEVSLAPRGVLVRAATTKGRRERFVPFSDVVDPFYGAYLRHRRSRSREVGPLFLSESRRNAGQPISIWTWSKVVAGLADRAALPRFSTHTLRHLRLTDLARAGWDLHEIALFAGHRSLETTMRYIQRSGRELAPKVARGMAQIHVWRTALMAEVLQ
jgi:integrase/recombinase XerD